MNTSERVLSLAHTPVLGLGLIVFPRLEVSWQNEVLCCVVMFNEVMGGALITLCYNM